MPARLPRPTWDPSTVLSVDPSKDYTCVGYAASQGRKCKNRIAIHNRSLASSVLGDLAVTPLSERRKIRGLLEELAECMLCKAWHRNQVDDMVEEWKRQIRRERTRLEEAEPQVGEQLADLMRPTTRGTLTNPAPTNRATRSPRTSPLPTRTRTTTPTTGHRREPRPSPPPSPGAVQRETRSPSPASIPLPDSLPSSAPQSPLLQPHRPRTPPPPRTPAIAKATRKPIHGDSECPICYENLLPEDEPVRLVWCKGECGQNIHAECWGKWESSQIGVDGTRMEAKCVICREAWVN